MKKMGSSSGYFIRLFVIVLITRMTTASSGSIINRHSSGDIFSLPPGDCSPAACSSTPLSPATANATARLTRSCQCQCPTERPVYREDHRQCVNTIEECSLADYVSGMQSEKVPFVFLPAQGQLINPNAEIALSDVRAEGQMVVSPVCVVSKAHFLSRSGWVPTDNSSTSPDLMELPFALAREAGRTHLQWLGESRLRSLMEGRIVLVKLLCKDTANVRIGVFSPCIGFRVAGSPGMLETLMIGRSDPDSAEGIMSSETRKKTGPGLRSADYIAIGISAGLLGCLYIAGLVGFLCYRRRKRQLENNQHVKLGTAGAPRDVESGPDDPTGLIRLHPQPGTNQKQNSRAADSSRNQRSSRSNTPNNKDPSAGQRPSSRGSKKYSDGNRHHQSSSGGIHQAMNYARFSERDLMMMEQQQLNDPSLMGAHHPGGYFYNPSEAAAAAAAVQHALNSRRIFFSPAYFDPDLLRSPPPAALEFLTRIRGMIEIAKDRMSSKRFMPTLVDIPEELSGYGGTAQRLSGRHQLGSRSSSFNDRGAQYGTLKNAGQTLLKNSLKRSPNGSRDGIHEDQDDGQQQQLYPAMELRATNFLQKSPLPVRKSMDGLVASLYTNPSIEDIYRSLDRLKSESIHNKSANNHHQQQKSRTGKAGGRPKKVALSESCDSDAVSDLVSEAESKLPKISTPKGAAPSATTRKTYFEPDSLDRSAQQPSGRSHIYQKKPQRGSTKNGSLSTTPQYLSSISHHPHPEEADEAASAGYTSSTCASVQSLSRVLPVEEAMEVGNQLFNMDTGAPTLPRPSGQRSGGNNIYDVIRKTGKDGNKGMYINHEFRKPPSVPTTQPAESFGSSINYEAASNHSAGSSSSSSKVTVVEESYGGSSPLSKLTIHVESPPASVHGMDEEMEEEEAFEPDTLERSSHRNNNRVADESYFRRQSNYMPDSLERPIQPVKSTIQQLMGKKAPISPSSASSSSGLGSSTASMDWNIIKKEELPPPGSVVSLRQMYNKHQHPHKHSGSQNKTSSSVKKDPPEEDPSAPPPLPAKSLAGTLKSNKNKPAPPPPAIPRNLKPSSSAGVHQHPAKDPAAPILPPKNGKRGSSSSSKNTAASSSEPPSERSLNVLERIARIEQESRTSGASSSSSNNSSSQTKGMEIALALKARMGHLEGSLKDHKKTSSIKKTWRKLLDKVEDSFSETESAVSTLVRPKKVKKEALPAPEEEEETPSDDEEEEDDDHDSQGSGSGSLGSDGTGVNKDVAIADSMTLNINNKKLKNFYAFGQELPGSSSTTSSSIIPPKKGPKLMSYSTNYKTSIIGEY